MAPKGKRKPATPSEVDAVEAYAVAPLGAKSDLAGETLDKTPVFTDEILGHEGGCA